MDRIEAMSAFAQVVEQGSFARAAERLLSGKPVSGVWKTPRWFSQSRALPTQILSARHPRQMLL